jgi:hypothetical protein
MTEAVIVRAFLCVAQNGIRFGSFFKFFFGFAITWIAVGVVLERQLAISALDFLLGGAARNTEDVVVVPFSVQL